MLRMLLVDMHIAMVIMELLRLLLEQMEEEILFFSMQRG